MSLMRTYRRALTLSQSAFAAQLNVPLETYRPWDAGRREPPPQLLTRARTLAGGIKRYIAREVYPLVKANTADVGGSTSAP